MLGQAFDHLVVIEGGFADTMGDRGGKTMYGISSTTYPGLSKEIANKTLPLQTARTIYERDYYYAIPGIEWLEINMPELAWLLFIGKVHGSGDEHLTELIQRTLNVIFSKDVAIDGVFGNATLSVIKTLSHMDRVQLQTIIYGSVETLATRRSKSVGIKHDSIKSRVNHEHLIAKSYKSSVDETVLTLNRPGTWTRHDGIDFSIFLRS